MRKLDAVSGRLPRHPSVNLLTSLPDSVLSKCRRSRHIKFQHRSLLHHYGILGMKDEKLTFRKAEGVELVEVPDGRLIYDKTRERVILLNVTAAAVLELCDGETDATRIAVLMQDAFQLSEPPQSDVEACLRSLVSEGLVETCELRRKSWWPARLSRRALLRSKEPVPEICTGR